MNFESRVRQLASGASLNLNEVDYRHAILKFSMDSGRVQPLWIIPFDDIWEFSVPSAIMLNSAGDFPHSLLILLLTQNAKKKRSFWAIEQINNKYCLSAMLNFPADSLTPSEFRRICGALVFDVEQIGRAHV